MASSRVRALRLGTNRRGTSDVDSVTDEFVWAGEPLALFQASLTRHAKAYADTRQEGQAKIGRAESLEVWL